MQLGDQTYFAKLQEFLAVGRLFKTAQELRSGDAKAIVDS